MFVFKLTWMGVLGLFALIYGLVEQDLTATIAGAVFYGLYALIFKTLNPIKPWLKKKDSGDTGPQEQPAVKKQPVVDVRGNTNGQKQPAVNVQKQPVVNVQQPVVNVQKQVTVPHPPAPLPKPGKPVDLNTLCPGCMSTLGKQVSACPYCGWQKDQNNPNHMLSVGSFLAGRYMVGRSIGQGGFGITYLGWDIPRSERVAVKEYYPSSSVGRSFNRYGVEPLSTQGAPELFEKGKKKFFDEAQRLNKFQNVPGIVNVWDFFQENNTAYIVMEYVEGQTLREYLDKLNMPLALHDALMLLAPVANSLEQIHAVGMLHRDINPGNIMLTRTGEAKLLDFGAARDFSLMGEHTNTINVTLNYAPKEQYLTHGNQGPWTDEYALAATIYHAVTGRKPPQSIERDSVPDVLVKPRALGANMTAQQEAVLLKGMAVDYKNRYKTVREFYQALSK